MVVIASPLRLKFSVAAVFLSVPLVALEVMIATHSPWWNLPLRGMGYWALAYFLLCLPIALWILAGRRWAYSLLRLLFLIWILASLTMAIRNRLPALGFFSLFLAMLSWIELTWLRRELGRSFLDPRIYWFQSLPKPIPGLKCRVGGSGDSEDLAVSRLDGDGAFVFVPYSMQRNLHPFKTHLKSHQGRKKFPLEFEFRGSRLSCFGNPVIHLNRGIGAGFQFLVSSADARKEIGEFVERLRGEGHGD